MSETARELLPKNAELPPQPKGSKISNAIDYSRNPYEFLKRCRRELGDNFTLCLPNSPPMVFSCDPAVIKAAFKLKDDEFDASLAPVPFDVGEKGITFINGTAHQRQRRLIFPRVHNEGLNTYNETMLQTGRQVIDRWQVGDEIDLVTELEHITLTVIIRCVFGATDESTVDMFRELVKNWSRAAINPKVAMSGMLLSGKRQRTFLNKRSMEIYRKKSFNNPLLKLLPWGNITVARARLLDALMTEVEKARAASDLDRTDLLNLYALTRTEDGNYLDEEMILSELHGLLVAGHETTTISSAWALTHILGSAEVVEKIRTEISSTFDDGRVDPARIDELTYLAAAIDESQRLNPIAVAVPRALIKPVELAGLSLPAGVNFLPCSFLVQHREDVWGSDVEEYRPERMLEDKINLNQYLPFGGGRRRCIGAAFAERQMRIQLAELLSRCDLRLPDGYAPQAIQAGQAVGIANGLSAVLEKKSKAVEV